MTDFVAKDPQRLQHLLEVCRNISSHLDLEMLLDAILTSARALTASENSAILLFHAGSQRLRYVIPRRDPLEMANPREVPLENSVAGWVFTHNRPYLIYQGEENHPMNLAAGHPLDAIPRSILAVPLGFRGQPIGVLEAVNKAGSAPYDPEDGFILETLASQAAIALENHRLLAESRQAYQKALELDRMKSDFVAIASHELRTPLGVIIGHASFLEETALPGQREALRAVVGSALRLKEIIDTFEHLDRFENGLGRLLPSLTVLQPLVQEVCDTLSDLATERQVQLVPHQPASPIAVECDRGKIAVALRELIKNGLIFTNPGGQVHVQCEAGPDFARLTVSDNGIGIAPDEQSRIFERFYQVESHLTRRHGGMGLGLSIAKNMVELHGGRLTVESMAGKGSRFTLVLPRAVVQSAAARVFL